MINHKIWIDLEGSSGSCSTTVHGKIKHQSSSVVENDYFIILIHHQHQHHHQQPQDHFPRKLKLQWCAISLCPALLQQLCEEHLEKCRGSESIGGIPIPTKLFSLNIFGYCKNLNYGSNKIEHHKYEMTHNEDLISWMCFGLIYAPQ